MCVRFISTDAHDTIADNFISISNLYRWPILWNYYSERRDSFDTPKRATHSDRASTEIYKEGHIKWNEIPDVIIDWRIPP